MLKLLMHLLWGHLWKVIDCRQAPALITVGCRWCTAFRVVSPTYQPPDKDSAKDVHPVVRRM